MLRLSYNVKNKGILHVCLLICDLIPIIKGTHTKQNEFSWKMQKVLFTKLLGLTFSANLTWNVHIEEVVKKARKRLYFLGQLKRAKLPPTDLILLYNTCMRSVIDYTVQVFYNALPQYLINELIHIEKRAISSIMPDTSYNNACEILGESPIVDHIDSLCDELFYSITSDKDHRLNSLLPPLYKNPRYNLRNYRPYDRPHVRTNRANKELVYPRNGPPNESIL